MYRKSSGYGNGHLYFEQSLNTSDLKNFRPVKGTTVYIFETKR